MQALEQKKGRGGELLFGMHLICILQYCDLHGTTLRDDGQFVDICMVLGTKTFATPISP